MNQTLVILESLRGQKLTSALEQQIRSNFPNVRILMRGMIYTADFSLHRLNVHVDAHGFITGASTG
jgi:hypothetical protein